MRNVAVILAIAFSFFTVGFVVITNTGGSIIVESFDGLLRLHEGQVQVMRGGEWEIAELGAMSGSLCAGAGTEVSPRVDPAALKAAMNLGNLPPEPEPTRDIRREWVTP